jgi:hypothetical protein
VVAMSLAAIHRRIVMLEAEMKSAVAAEDFERAAWLRDQIAELRGEGGPSLVRKPPDDQIGMGTGIPVVQRPKGWRPPKKPSPMTTNVKPRGKR